MEEYQKMLADIDSTAKCPVCLERVRSPTALCNNGHAICRQCKHSQQKCPTCRAPFSRINPVFLNAIMDLLPSQCRNSYRGCHQILYKNSLDGHERECRFRQEKCIIRRCPWNEEVSALLDHVSSQHPQSLMLPKASVKVPDFIVSDEEYSVFLVSSNDCLFWVFITNNFYKKQIPVFVKWLQRHSNVPSVICNVTVVKDHFSFSYSQTLDAVEPVEQILCSTLAKQFLVTPNSIFPNFINSKYLLEIRIDLQLKCD